MSGLPGAEGGFETPLGWYGVQWSVSGKTFKLSIEVPTGTSGTVTLPFAGKTTADGKSVIVSSQASIELAGGRHDIVVLL